MDSIKNFTSNRWAPWILAVSLCVNLGIAGAVFANRARQSPAHTPIGNATLTDDDASTSVALTPELVRRLALTEEQRAQMASMKRELMASTVPLYRQAMEERRELMSLLRAPLIDEMAVGESLKKIQRIQAQTQEAVVAHVAAERKLLRPEQVESFNALVLPRLLGVLAAAPTSKAVNHTLHADPTSASTNQ